MSRSHLALKALEVIADGHSKGQQLLERLLRLVESYSDPAWLETDADGKVLDLLIDNSTGRFNEKLGPFEPFLLQLRQDFGNVASALPLVVAVIPLGDAAQAGDKRIPIGQAVGSHAVGDARSEDLLGSAAADAQQEFEGGAVDERPGQELEFADDLV
jgi:hypothetical protein